jgi:hypothetical protein
MEGNPDAKADRTAGSDAPPRAESGAFARRPRPPGTEGATAVTTVRTVIQGRRIEVPAPEDLPDGTEVILRIGTDVADDDGPMSPAEIARVLAAMGRMQPQEIPDDVAADLDARERTPDRHGIDHAGEGVEGLGPVK